MAHIFETELATYSQNLSALQKDSGKFVLIKGDAIEGVFDTYADALRRGYGRFGRTGFFVRQISAADKVLHFTRNIVPVCPS